MLQMSDSSDIRDQIFAAAAPFSEGFKGIDGRLDCAVDRRAVADIAAIDGAASVGLHSDYVCGAIIANVELGNGECVSVALTGPGPEKAIVAELIGAISKSGGDALSWRNTSPQFDLEDRSWTAEYVVAEFPTVSVAGSRIDLDALGSWLSENLDGPTRRR
jgi:hypothetical protein